MNNRWSTRSMKLIRIEAPPLGMDEAHYRRWQAEIGELMAQLKRAGRKIVSRSRDPVVIELFDALQASDADTTGCDLVEHLYEFAAFHVPGRGGRTMAECAVEEAHRLPREVRGAVAALADSHWDLYEVEAASKAGAIKLRRLHDDASVELAGLERPQALVAGAVVALRVFDAGGFAAAPVALVPGQEGLTRLVSRLEVEEPGPFATRGEYMRRRGSALILRHALQCHVLQFAEAPPMPEPEVSLVESDLEPGAWRRLGAAFSLLESVLSGQLSERCPLALTAADGSVLRVDQHGTSIAVMLFARRTDKERWESRCASSTFVRAWRASADELFAEDVELLERLGLEPRSEGAAVAIRLDEGLWDDVSGVDIDRLIQACQWAALRVQADDELAA